jgi:F0F1-type ATP synthase assembly protein I
MSSALDVAKKQTILIVLALVVGVALGVPVGWATVKVVNTTPAVLREDLQEDYLRMAIDSFRVNRDPNLAVRHWDALGPSAAPIFVRIQKDPSGIDPVVIVAFGEVIQAVKGTTSAVEKPEAGAPRIPGAGSLLVVAIVVLALVGLAAAIFFVRRFTRRRSKTQLSPTSDEDANQDETAKSRQTNFESLGVAPPITQNMTTYVLGDDLYDESFSIDTASGDFLGEYGVGVSETIGIGEPKKVTALEIWLFDKNDIKTATKVVMSAHAFGDSSIRGRLEAKGELIQVEPQKQIMLETETLQLLATVVDLQYGDGAMPDKSYFERLTLELAIWHKTGK